MINKAEWYDPNNVNADNFNETMDGYMEYAINYCLTDNNPEFTKEHINTIRAGFYYAKDFLTMEQARKYKRKY